jgi:hypothetical protein
MADHPRRIVFVLARRQGAAWKRAAIIEPDEILASRLRLGLACRHQMHGQTPRLASISVSSPTWRAFSRKETARQVSENEADGAKTLCRYPFG